MKRSGFNDSGFYTSDTKPLGKSWTEWIANWWRWCLADHFDSSPAADTTGRLCCKNQTNPDVWFLAGTFGGNAKRKCIISKEKSILFPIVNDLISYAEYKNLVSERDLSEYAKNDLDTARVYRCSIDNEPLYGTEKCRVQSELFDLTLPLESNGKLLPTLTKAVSDGYWIFLKPLPKGEHYICFRGEKALYDDIQYFGYKGDNGLFKVEVQYDILVR